MPAPTTTADVLRLLAQSRLLEPPALERFQAETPPAQPLAEVAQRLVVSGKVTVWQARQLLAGGSQFILGRYKLLERLGAGARSKVYLAEQEPSGRQVALKVLDPELLDDPEAFARWKREIRLAAALTHPSIITAIDSGQHGSLHYIVMEYVSGRDLKRWVEESSARLPVDWCCEVIRQAAVGLAHAHDHGVIHRDVKSGNLLVVAENERSPPITKILDMGFARRTTETDVTRITQPWQTFGTPEYMAPEQAESAAAADGRSDIFSLGCTLFKALTGEFPFGGITKMQKILARCNHDARPVREYRHDAPRELEQLLARMLARRREDRFQTCREVAAALTPFALRRGD